MYLKYANSHLFGKTFLPLKYTLQLHSSPYKYKTHDERTLTLATGPVEAHYAVTRERVNSVDALGAVFARWSFAVSSVTRRHKLFATIVNI